MPIRLRYAVYFQICAVAIVSVLWAPTAADAQALPAFSGAEGFGGTFTGTAPAGGWFSNATVYHVTTNQDLVDSSGKPLPGTLRYAFYTPTSGGLKQNASNEIVVFDVGGVFQLTNGSLDIKTVNNIYIAGQTAPSPIVVYGDTTQITHSSNTQNSNLILRYMTFRRGSATGGNDDSLTFAGGSDDGSGSVATNMIIDHASTSWATDEDLSVANNNTNITVQYSIIADSLRSDHAYGSLIRPRINSNVSYLDNLYANNLSRNPRPGTYNNATLNFDFENNVVYNWANRAGYTGGASEGNVENVNMNYVGNYAIAGPSTPTGTSSTTAFTKDTSQGSKDPLNLKVYQSGNRIDSDHGVNPGGVPNGTDTGWGMFVQTNGTTTTAFDPNDEAATPFVTTGIPVAAQSAADAYNQLITKDGHGYVGNSWWARDPIDARIVSNVTSNTNPPSGVAGTAPDPAELSTMLATPIVTRPANWDTDGDGMPDVWEKSMGLNPNSAADAFADADGDGYVNVQEYLDEIGAFPAPGPVIFTGVTNNRYAQITNWNMAFQPSRFDEVQINSGTVVVDAAGQHAGTLKIAANAGNSASMNITSGWLQVDNQVIIGATDSSSATLNLSGGDLTAAILSKGANGVFNFTGGTLHAGTVTFDLVDKGGTIAPGNRANAVTIVDATPVALSSIGQTHVEGNLTMQSGSMQIELASSASFDQVIVDGLFTPGGTLSVSLLNGFAPQLGNSFDILNWGTRSGKFAIVSLPALASPLAWNTSQLYTTGVLSIIDSNFIPGDINRDGKVSAADIAALLGALSDLSGYESSHNNLTNQQLLEIADLNGDGVVSNVDIQSLINQVANSAAIGDGDGAITAVPEPAALTLSVLALLSAALVHRCRPRKDFLAIPTAADYD